MNKYVTFLPVIAVMFTFSFGSAFAATDAEKAAVLAQAKAVAEKVVADNYETAMKKVVSTETSAFGNLGYTEADAKEVAAAWEKVDVKGQLATLIEKAYAAEAKNFANYDADAAVYAAKVFTARLEMPTATYGGSLSYKNASGAAQLAADHLADVIVSTCGLEAVRNMYEADRAELLSAFDKINWTVYSNDVDPDDADERTYLEIAEDIVAEAKAYIADDYQTWPLSDYTVNSPAGLASGTIPAIKSYIESKLTAETFTVSGVEYKTGLYLVDTVATKTSVEADKAANAATEAALKAAVAQDYANLLKNAPATNKTNASKAVEMLNFLIEEGIVKNVNAGDVAKWMNAPYFAKNAAEIEDLEAYAAKYAAEKDATGALVRDAEDIEDIVVAEKIKAYGNVYAEYDNANAKTKIAALSVDADAYALMFAKEEYKSNLADALDALDVANTYYAKEAAVIQANYEAGIAKIEAATSVTKVQNAYNAVNLTKGAVTAATVDGYCTYLPGSAEKAAFDAVDAYVKYIMTGKTVLNADYIDWNNADVQADAKDAIEEIYGEAGARTAAERKAVAIDAAAVAAELVTVGDLSAAKAAAEAAIKALPTTITVADKDAVVAAFDLVEDYYDLTGHGTLTTTKLEKAITDLYAAMTYDFAKQISTVDKTDKVALNALQDEIDAANKLVKADKVFEGKAKFDAAGVVDTAIKAIRTKELAAVQKAIKAIPVNVTEADKAQVEAARALYDAFVAEYTDYETPYNAVNAVGAVTFRELALAEAALGLNAEDEAYSVEALKITARSTVKKGSITVKWSVEGDTDAVEGYEVFRSVKKNSGFGTKPFFTTTKMSYKNTKNLKAGTRYYFKVRAFATTEEGEKVYSDWSNKAYRVAK